MLESGGNPLVEPLLPEEVSEEYPSNSPAKRRFSDRQRPTLIHAGRKTWLGKRRHFGILAAICDGVYGGSIIDCPHAFRKVS
jgi:hypothetical protein